ncbi:hypothetical protein Q0812_04665 [Brevundimonas sp. 2R-24]|uniref:DUF996 domain-containing protein n=1 Tax=Peiella sedimenti TaxID=3061083 RepID=A0ABT8SJG4_9CAUL|nr:hypothetical protein [Caulobacteraceae bacterium XZ-24]
MTETAFSGRGHASSSDDRNLAFIAYGLMFAAPFVFGLTSLIAVVIAYVRKPEADAVNASHFRFQIRSFWISFGLAILSAAALLVGVGFLLADLVTLATNNYRGWEAWEAASVDAGALRLHAATVIGLIIFVIAYVSAGLWAIASALFGMARLSAQGAIGRPAA